MRGELRELWKFRELLISMVQREIKIRYKNSVLGVVWSLINPLVTTLVLTIVFSVFMDNGVHSFSAYVLAAYLPFMFFQFAVLDSAQSVLTALPLVKKIYFPREILPLSVILSNFIHLLMGFGVFFLFLAIVYFRDPRVLPFQATTLFLPALLVVSFMLATGVGLIVSALNTFYEDVKYLVGVVMYLLFFMSPIMYFSETVAYSRLNQETDGLLYKAYHLNPVAALSTLYRQYLLAPQGIRIDGKLQDPIRLDPLYLVYCAVFALVMMLIGYHLFNRMKWRFVERP